MTTVARCYVEACRHQLSAMSNAAEKKQENRLPDELEIETYMGNRIETDVQDNSRMTVQNQLTVRDGFLLQTQTGPLSIARSIDCISLSINFDHACEKPLTGLAEKAV